MKNQILFVLPVVLTIFLSGIILPVDAEISVPTLLGSHGSNEKGSKWFATSTIVNPSASTITVTQIDMCWEDQSPALTMSDQLYPTSGWTISSDCMRWSGSETVLADTATSFYGSSISNTGSGTPSDITFDAVITEISDLSARSVGQTTTLDMDSLFNVYWEEKAGDNTETFRDGADIKFFITTVDTGDASIDADGTTNLDFTVQYEETLGAASVKESASTFVINIPPGFADVTVESSDFSDADTDATVTGDQSSGWQITATGLASITNEADSITFSTTMPFSEGSGQIWYEFSAIVDGINGNKGTAITDIQGIMALVLDEVPPVTCVTTCSATINETVTGTDTDTSVERDPPYVAPNILAWANSGEKGSAWWTGLVVQNTNLDGDDINITDVVICPASSPAFTAISDSEYPTSGWTENDACVIWSGNETVEASNQTSWRVAATTNTNVGVGALTYTVTSDEFGEQEITSRGSVGATDMDSLINMYWESTADDTTGTTRSNSNIEAIDIEDVFSTGLPLYENTAYEFTLNVEEAIGNPINSDATTWLNMTLPLGWSSVSVSSDDFTTNAQVETIPGGQERIYKNNPCNDLASGTCDTGSFDITFSATSPTVVSDPTLYVFEAMLWSAHGDKDLFHDIQADLGVKVEGIAGAGHDPVIATDTFTFVETNSLLQNYVQTGTDTFTFVETDQQAKTYAPISTTDTWTFIETSSGIGGYIRSGSETFTFVETHESTQAETRVESDTFAFVETTDLKVSYIRSGSDTFAFVESTDVTGMFTASGLDTFAFVESTQIIQSYAPIITTDTFTFVETHNESQMASRTGSDTFAFVETSDVFQTYIRDSTDTITFVETAPVVPPGAGNRIETDIFIFVETVDVVPPFVPTGQYIWFWVNEPTSDRLGGIYAATCPGGFYVSGISVNGTLICTSLP